MKNILLILTIYLFSSSAFADEIAIKEGAQQKSKPTYMECFELAEEKLVNEHEKIKQQIKQRDLPATVEYKKFDIRKYNPKIKPKSSDIKSSLEVDLPNYKNKKGTANNNSSYSCKTLYGL